MLEVTEKSVPMCNDDHLFIRFTRGRPFVIDCYYSENAMITVFFKCEDEKYCLRLSLEFFHSLSNKTDRKVEFFIDTNADKLEAIKNILEIKCTH